MATIKTVYLGEMRTEATHLRSGQTIVTDAPVDNQGKGEYFSPTDLVAAALGSCMLTIMGQAAKTHGIDIDGTKLSINKVMTAAPRRIGEIEVDVTFPSAEYTPKQKMILEHAAATCPVAHSLFPECKQTVRYIYGE